ncbi:hypothetical protein SAMN05421858_3463 [Haladaptatus litoreus]|uniref:Uncharacterized protein n=1 Tax=Haladaptatus litoreus TaxID=553468 RepID=A0A1N7DAK8_9EURY|nr:hypothetical protein SAMN05421858_3463 [Haladaptatus litoreus]
MGVQNQASPQMTLRLEPVLGELIAMLIHEREEWLNLMKRRSSRHDIGIAIPLDDACIVEHRQVNMIQSRFEASYLRIIGSHLRRDVGCIKWI